ncbi:MAG: hypothetical protein ACIAQZ_03715 [Sedimentisphaeraceae bacterium JB056]
MKNKLSIGSKLGLVSGLFLLFSGMFLSKYIPEEIINESATLTQTDITYKLSMICMLYDFICGFAIAFFVIVGFVCILKKTTPIIVTMYVLVIAILSFAFIYFPKTEKPWYRYQFTGFIEGVKQNIDQKEFREWSENVTGDVKDGGNKMFGRGELSFLSKNEEFECETYVNKYKNDRYEIKMHWGGPMGHYGLYVTNDLEKLNYMKSNNDVVEVYENIWAWTENK